MWDFGCSLKIKLKEKATGEEHVSVPAFVLDYGYAAGAEEAMVEVLMGLMAMAAEGERRDLMISLPTESRLFSLMDDLPHSTTLFRILTPGTPDTSEDQRLGVPRSYLRVAHTGPVEAARCPRPSAYLLCLQEVQHLFLELRGQADAEVISTGSRYCDQLGTGNRCR